MTQIICFGEMLIDFVPTVNGTTLADAPAFKKAPGGAPANVSAGLAKLGRDTAFLGKVGDDPFGHLMIQTLADAGVDTTYCLTDPTARTALAFVTLKDDGEREFMFYRHPSADMLLTPDEIPADALKKASIFHYGSISLIAEPCRSAHLHALDILQETDCLLSYDPNLRLPLWESPAQAKAAILSIWETAGLIKINEDELEFLTGSSDIASARTLWHDSLKCLLVTVGAEGAYYFTPETEGHVAGIPVKAVDTTGAGDAFVAGFLSQLVSHPDLLADTAALQSALRFANVAGAITATGRGAIPSLPTPTQIREYLNT